MRVLAPLLLVSLAGCSALAAVEGVQGSGHPRTESRTVTSFTAIQHDSIGDVELRVGRKASLTVKADDNLLSKITTRVEKGVLVIANKENIHPKTPVKFIVTTPAIDRVELNGVGDIRSEGVHGRTMAVKLNGVGGIDLRGAVDELNVELNGVGDANLSKLTARNVHVKSNGTGNVSVTATKRIAGQLNGVGDINYRGNPANVDIKNKGVGKVTGE